MDLNAEKGTGRSDSVKVVAIFYLIACGFSWLVWLPLILGSAGLKVLTTSVSFPVFVCIGTLGPLLGCFVAYRCDTGHWGAVHVLPRRRIQWIWVAFGPLLIIFSRVFVFSALSTQGGPAAWRWHIGALIGIWIPMFNYNLFGGPLFEEFGWRGFLQSRLQRSLPPWISAVLVGVMWAIWHLPLFILGWGGVTFPLFLLILVGVSVIMAFAFNGSGESVFVAILMHSAFNAANRVIPAFLFNVPTRQRLSEGSLIAMSFLLVAAVLAALTGGWLLRSRAD
jgi:membrane protease YdiL (CAAX protease family)